MLTSCQTIPQEREYVFIPVLEEVRPGFPLDELILEVKTDSDLLHNYNVVSGYNLKQDEFIDAVFIYIAKINKILQDL